MGLMPGVMGGAGGQRFRIFFQPLRRARQKGEARAQGMENVPRARV